MSFTKKYAKFKRDPELFFQDSITKQYSKVYKFVNSIKNSKRGVSKAFSEIHNDKITVPSSNDSSTSSFFSTSKKQLKDKSIGPNDITLSARSKELVNTASTILTNVKTNVHTDNTKAFKDYFDEVTIFTQQYDVNSLRLSDKNIWTYLRHNLWIHMNFVAIGKANWRNVSSVHIYNSHRTQIPETYRIEAIDNYGAMELEDLDKKDEAEILFFVLMNSGEQVQMDSGIYHRVTDPFFEVASQLTTAKKIELVKSATPSISKNKDFIHPATILLPPILEKAGYSEKLNYNKNLFNAMKQFMPSLNTLSEAELKKIVDYDMNIKDFYTEIFKLIKPKVVFLYAFHYNAPMIEAADELGILTVDIQHGLQVGWNPLYTNYDEMPPEGYSQVPDYFAVWGEKEYQSILNSFPSEKHRPIYMGNPWLEKIKTFPVSFSKNILDILQFDSYDKRILIIMQNQTNIPQTFIDIIEETKNDNILWIIRHHPKGERYVQEDFSKDNSNILVSDEIDKVLFSELFKHVDITISEGSALAIEASYFGVTNIVTSVMGADNYKKEINDEIFYYLDNSSSFRNILNKIESNKGKVDTSHLFKKADTEKFIKNLLKAADEKKSKILMKDKVDASKLRNIKNNVEANILAQLEKANYLAKNHVIDNAMAAFKDLRNLLLELPAAKDEYGKEEMLWIKDARVFQRKIRDEFNISPNEEDVILIGDSLILPRPLETKNVNFGMTRSYAYMFNDNSYGLSLLPWAQRYLTTTKLLNNWEELVKDLEDKYLVIHLGINDSAERIFSEEQRTAMAALTPEIKKGVLEFGKVYRKDIINSQDNYSYVPVSEFEKNVKEIVKRALDGGVKSLTFIKIIPFPQSHETNSPGAIENCKRYNAVFDQVAKESAKVKVIDTKSILDNVKKHSGILKDNVHLSIPGHRALANAIFSKIVIDNDENKVYRVALIGVGNLGSRHLQGLAKSNNKLSIECFEPNQSNIDLALERFKEVIGDSDSDSDIALQFVDSLQSFSEDIDVAIIATNADIRAEVVEDLLNEKNVKNIVLEKVLFQDEASYYKIKDLIENKDVTAWVNHPRRLFDIHKPLLVEIRKSNKLSFQVSGVNWGLGSNGLHFLDLLTWLTNTENGDVELGWNSIGRSIGESKRPKFREIYGTISGAINDKVDFSITSLKPQSSEVQLPTISIVSDKIKVFIDEYNGVINYALENDGWHWHSVEGEFPLLFQSQMTSKIVDDIIDNGQPSLPSYQVSMMLHLPFISAVKAGIEEFENVKLASCPIS